MAKIIKKEQMAPAVKLYEVHAPAIATKALPGQFVIVRVAENGERIPLTIADTNVAQGTITLIVQEVGKSTILMGTFPIGTELTDLVGPLGHPTHIEKVGSVVTIGGGIGVAPLHPIAKALHNAGNIVHTVIGARTKELVIWEEKMAAISHKTYVTTDDGSYGRQGFVTDQLNDIMSAGPVDMVVAIGPMIMMKAVCNVTREAKIKTIVSLNPIMIDGTGMCGGCRVTVGDEVKFACVDGPEFDGHLVNFDEMLQRQVMYKKQEGHSCRAVKS